MTVRILALVFFSFLIAFIFFHSPSVIHTLQTCPSCNVIIITIDSLRADRLPCYGYPVETAPSICKFAKKSALLNRAYANASWTLPSEMSLFTGLYPTSHMMGTTLKNQLSPTIRTLTQILASYGYVTTFISNNQPNVSPIQFGQGFSTIHITPNDTDSSETVHTWLNAIDSIKEANGRRKPAFVFLHTDGVHDYAESITKVPKRFPLDPAYTPPQLDNALSFTDVTARMTREWVDLTVNETLQASQASYIRWREQLKHLSSPSEVQTVFNQLPPEAQNSILAKSANWILTTGDHDRYVELIQHLYDESIQRTDLLVGRILERLSQEHLLRNTIVIITSEHGELLDEQGIIGHGTILLDPEIHVPLIVYVPRIPADTYSDLVQGIDVYPTILDFLNIPIPKTSAGISIRGLLTHEPTHQTNAYVISEWDKYNKSIVTPLWHLITVKLDPQSQPRVELYNYGYDPREQHNVFLLYPDVAQSLQMTLGDILSRQPKYPSVDEPFPGWLNAQQRERLIKTGYFF